MNESKILNLINDEVPYNSCTCVECGEIISSYGECEWCDAIQPLEQKTIIVNYDIWNIYYFDTKIKVYCYSYPKEEWEFSNINDVTSFISLKTYLDKIESLIKKYILYVEHAIKEYKELSDYLINIKNKLEEELKAYLIETDKYKLSNKYEEIKIEFLTLKLSLSKK